MLVETPDAQALGQTVRIALVALLPSARSDSRNHDLVDVWVEGNLRGIAETRHAG